MFGLECNVECVLKHIVMHAEKCATMHDEMHSAGGVGIGSVTEVHHQNDWTSPRFKSVSSIASLYVVL